MTKIQHKIAGQIILLLTSLPFFILDVFSYLNFILIRYIFKYRLKLVKQNIKKSFPKKSEKEINKIVNKFYLHFTDLIFETIKVGSFSHSQYKKHIKFTNLDYLDSIQKQNKNIVLIAGHFSNWEWVSSLPMFTTYSLLAIYKPLKSTFWNNLIKTIREKFGSITVPMSETYRVLNNYTNSKKPYIVGLVSDQCPPKNKAVWSQFLGQDTAYYPGPEKISKDKNATVLYLSVKKIKRHKYEASFKLVAQNPVDLKNGEIIQIFSKLLEKDVIKQPELYIWSHKRWKYKKTFKID